MTMIYAVMAVLIIALIVEAIALVSVLTKIESIQNRMNMQDKAIIELDSKFNSKINTFSSSIIAINRDHEVLRSYVYNNVGSKYKAKHAADAADAIAEEITQTLNGEKIYLTGSMADHGILEINKETENDA